MLRNICLTVIKPYFKEKSIFKILNYSLVHTTCDLNLSLTLTYWMVL